MTHIDGEAPPDPTARRVRRRRLTGSARFRMGLATGVVVTVAVALLVIQNDESVQINWLNFHGSRPLWQILLLTAAAGAVVAWLVKSLWQRSWNRRRRRTTSDDERRSGQT